MNVTATRWHPASGQGHSGHLREDPPLHAQEAAGSGLTNLGANPGTGERGVLQERVRSGRGLRQCKYYHQKC